MKKNQSFNLYFKCEIFWEGIALASYSKENCKGGDAGWQFFTAWSEWQAKNLGCLKDQSSLFLGSEVSIKYKTELWSKHWPQNKHFCQDMGSEASIMGVKAFDFETKDLWFKCWFVSIFLKSLLPFCLIFRF